MVLQNPKTSSFRSIRANITVLAVIVTGVGLFIDNHHAAAQNSYTSEFVDAFAEEGVVKADSFNDAEQALLRGLSGRNEKPAKPSFPSAAEIKQVAATNPVVKGPTIRRVKSPVMQDNTHTDLGPAEDLFLDPEAAPVPSIKSDPISKAPTVGEQKLKVLSDNPIKSIKAESKQSKSSSGALNSLQKTIDQSENRIRDLERELSDAKSQLATAELEISRLSSIITSSSRARLGPTSIQSPTPSKVNPQNVNSVNNRAVAVDPTRTSKNVESVAPKTSPDSVDMQVATINVDKADLRLGPGKNHSALMSLRRGSRLAIEARQGEWYRVFAPNGQRAWIHSSLVRFGDGAANLNDGSTVKVRGFDARAQ